MEKRSFIVYYLLTFLLLGLIPILAAVFNNGSLDFDQLAVSASEKTGLEWTSNLLIVIRLILAEPILTLLILGSAVPALAAITTIIFLDRNDKWRKFWGRLNPIRNVSFQNGLKLYFQILIILVGGLLCANFIRQLTGGNYEWSNDLLSLRIIPALLVAAFLDQGAILEELGWRGFATPELQEKGVNPLKVALIIGICWGLWHVPRDITTGVIERLGIISYLLLFLPSFLLDTISVSIIASYYINKLGGSVIPAIVIHGLTNDSIGIAGQATIVEALTPYHQITKAIPFAIIAIVLVKMSGSMLHWDSKKNLSYDEK